ncbi:MAG: PadR family transcriptional regulator [Clostridium sp.]|nr:PadR family transcriptional regulator [Clostridium sp.]
MIELLILYSLKNRERTLYSLRSNIIEKFGYFTKPSIGTIHPALKRLLESKVITIRNDFSQGGKKSTFYGLSMHWQKKFNDLFFLPLSENPTIFFTELQSRIAVLSLLDRELKETFIKDALIKLESFYLDLKNTLEDEYIDFDQYQEELLKKNISDIENFKSFIEKLSVKD